MFNCLFNTNYLTKLAERLLIMSALILFMQANLHAAGTNKSWQCTVHDKTHMQWMAKSTYRRMAINKAYDACKKNSKYPKSCKAAIEYCEGFVNGMSTRPMWRCSALDFNAQAYRSNIYAHKYDAALAAKAYCKDNSSEPESCYIHPSTCSNLNPWSS